MKINLNYNLKVGTLEVHECDKKGRTKNKLILRDLAFAGDAAGKSKASEYIAGLRLISQSIKRGLKALKDWRPFIERREQERLERIERERREAREERRESERRARKNPKGWRHVRA